jgi:hypothetical protein
MRRIATTGLLMILALVGAGCGQDANATAIRNATNQFFGALSQGDGTRACTQLSAETIKSLEQDEKSACGPAVQAAGLRTSRIAHVAVYVTNAKVDLANGSSVYLEETASGWKLSALGCRATDGDPKEHPLSCTVQS